VAGVSFLHTSSELPSHFVVSISSKMDICIVSFIAPIDQEIGLFIHSAMAGGKSKDGGSVPKKGSR
jgi:hypothetical protein